jgi:hypothetical protein
LRYSRIAGAAQVRHRTLERPGGGAPAFRNGMTCASANKIGVGEQAHEYALSYWTGPGPRAYTWDCPACQQAVTDHGPYPDPARSEDGHDPACPRRAAELAAWEQHRPRW